MFHLKVGGSSEAVRILVGSLAAHLDSSNQLLDFSKSGIGFDWSSSESEVSPSGMRPAGLK